MSNVSKLDVQITVINEVAVTVCEYISVASAIEVGHFDIVDPRIYNLDYGLGSGKRNTQIVLVTLNKSIKYPDVLRVLTENKYNPVCLRDLLALAEQYPDIEEEECFVSVIKYKVLALGSRIWHTGGFGHCPSISRSLVRFRHLDLHHLGDETDSQEMLDTCQSKACYAVERIVQR